ncbi:hypothetical protein SLS54_003704 [Diplodia seriata]
MTLRDSLTGQARAFFGTLSGGDNMNLTDLFEASTDRFKWGMKALTGLKQGNRSMVHYGRNALDIQEALESAKGDRENKYLDPIQATLVDHFIENIRDNNNRKIVRSFTRLNSNNTGNQITLLQVI